MPAGRRAEVLEKAAGKERDVLHPLAQRGDGQRQHAEAVEEVLAEPPLLHFQFQLTVGGSHHPHIHLLHILAAHRQDLLGLQCAQQLHLQVVGHLADLVEEQRPLVGQGEHALVLPDGAGEGAGLVAEQLALQQVLRDRPAVHRDKGLGGPGPGGMDRPGQVLLAHAGLAEDQQRHVRRDHPLHQGQQLLHGGAEGDEVSQPRRAHGSRHRHPPLPSSGDIIGHAKWNITCSIPINSTTLYF